MKLLALIGLLLLALLLPTGHWGRQRALTQTLRQRAAPVQIIRSLWVAHALKTVRRVPAKS